MQQKTIFAKIFPLNNKWFLLFILSLIWGSSFILISKSLESFSFWQVGSLRIFIASLSLLPLSIKYLPKIPKALLKWVVLSAFLGNFLPMYLFPLAETQINSSIAGILNALVPLFVILLGVSIFKIHYKFIQIVGVFVGLLGCIFLIGFKDYQGSFNFNSIENHFQQIFSGSTNLFYAIFVIIATICYALNALIIKKKLMSIPSLHLSTSVFGVILIPGLIMLIISGFFSLNYNANFLHGMIYVSLLGLLGTALAMILFYKLIHISSTVFATSVTYLMPIIAVAWGIVFDEGISIYILIGAVLILFGVYLSKER